MEKKNWLNLEAKELLKEFGKGSYVPGSGSAAALQGLLSAQLLLTVIKITLKKPECVECHGEVTKMQSEIKDRIYSTLERLVQEDSDNFEKLIKVTNDIPKAIDDIKKSQLEKDRLTSQRIALEFPVTVANLCKELAEYSLVAFDRGYKKVRGDSGVALNGAVSAVGGCLSIIDLNLCDFVNDPWTRKIRETVDKLRSNFLRLKSEAQVRLDSLKKEAEDQISINSYHADIKPFLTPAWESSRMSYADIEKLTRQLQNTLWEHKNIIWKENTPKDLMDILKPEKVLPILGYEFQQHASLGQHSINGSIFEIAGLIDKQSMVVAVSKKFKPDTANFTAAHELGHALLHKEAILHRDKALDGSDQSSNRSETEKQADKFAAFFLMPGKLVEDIFENLFQTRKFRPSQNNVFALNQGRLSDFKDMYRDLNGLAEFMAFADYYDGRKFRSMAEIFNVSKGAMAIRLIELGLVEH